MITRWAPKASIASGLATSAGTQPAIRVPSRFTAQARGAEFWVVMWTLAVAAEFGALVPIIFGDDALVGADVVYRLVGGSFAAFGLIAWHRRPDSRSGPLMTATGFGLLVSLLLKQIHTGVALTAGEVLEDIWEPAFVALILSFVAGGRLQSRVERLIVAGSFFAAFVLDVFSMLYSEQPDNVLLVLPNETIYGAIDATQRGMKAVAAEFGALVPIIFGDDARSWAPTSSTASSAARSRRSACRLASAAGQPQRPADDRDRLRPARLAAAQADRRRRRADGAARCWRTSGSPPSLALILSFVTGGRLLSGVDRLIVAGSFVAAFVLDVFSMLFVEQPGNVLLVFPSETVAGAVDATQRALKIVLCIATCAVDRRALARGVSAAAPGAAAERRGRRVPADVRVAAGDRPLRGPAVAADDRGRVLARCSSCRRRSSPACCARGWRAAGSRSSSASWAGCAARRCRRRSDARSATRRSCWPTGCRTRAGYADAAGRPVLVPPVTPDRSQRRRSSATAARSPRSSTTRRSTTTRR